MTFSQNIKQIKSKKKQELNPPAILIFGGNGVGKSAFLAHIAANYLRDRTTVRSHLKRCNNRIDKWNKGGFKFSQQTDHLFYSTFRIGKRNTASKDVDMSRFGLRCDENPNPQVFPPCSTITIDEAQRDLNSRKGGIPEHISLWFEIRRHNGYTVYLATQREKLIDLNVRDLVRKIIEIDKMEQKYDKLGRLIRTTWTCYEFENCHMIDKYLASGKDKKLGQKVQYTFEGNIFKYYDHEACEAAFYDGLENCDFEAGQSPKKERTVKATQEFNKKNFSFRNNEKEKK